MVAVSMTPPLRETVQLRAVVLERAAAAYLRRSKTTIRSADRERQARGVRGRNRVGG
jgi:hypothetical protein